MGDDWEARLQAYLATLWSEPGLVITGLRRLSGGAQRETWAFEARGRSWVLQRDQPGTVADRSTETESALLVAAAQAGVPVPPVAAASATAHEIGSPFLLTGFVAGETIARKILRDEEFTVARQGLLGQAADALARIHAIPTTAVPGLGPSDELDRYRRLLDGCADGRPALELAFQWLYDHRPDSPEPVVVHGDFRLGNLIVGPHGLRAVLDWELAHLGDPMEDLAWFCVRAWRFGEANPVAGIGRYEALFDAYEAASGRTVDPDAIRWWEVLGSVKLAIMFIRQTESFTSGTNRSLEQAAVGRRVCENEYDALLHVAPESLKRPEPVPSTTSAAVHGRPSGPELAIALREWVEGEVRAETRGHVQFTTRIGANLLGMVERELSVGGEITERQLERLSGFGVTTEAEMAGRIRKGELRYTDPAVTATVGAGVVGKLEVANPRWFA